MLVILMLLGLCSEIVLAQIVVNDWIS